MNARRKTVGRRIKLARIAAGYRSQKAFADAIGKSEASVANAERGSDKVGIGVFGVIEVHLDWPEDCIAGFLETGDITLLPQRGADLQTADDELVPRDRIEQAIVNDPDLRRKDKLQLLREYRSRPGAPPPPNEQGPGVSATGT